MSAHIYLRHVWTRAKKKRRLWRLEYLPCKVKINTVVVTLILKMNINWIWKAYYMDISLTLQLQYQWHYLSGFSPWPGTILEETCLFLGLIFYIYKSKSLGLKLRITDDLDPKANSDLASTSAGGKCWWKTGEVQGANLAAITVVKELWKS